LRRSLPKHCTVRLKFASMAPVGEADILDRPVVRPLTKDATTALGAAYAAGLAVGYFKDLNDLRANWAADRTWTPNLKNGKRDEMYNLWKRAVTRSFDWVS
jgi:glycerol kinase